MLIMTDNLRYKTEADDIYAKLKEIKRTGWVMRGVINPETVYEHTVALISLAASLQAELSLSDTELDDLQHILEIHDWAEAIVGDEFVPNDDTTEYRKRKKIKGDKERHALEQLLVHKPYQEAVIKLFIRYEQGTDKVAKLAKELDKYQALELAYQYEQEQGIPLFLEFYNYYKRDWPFTQPVLIARIDNLRKQHGNTM